MLASSLCAPRASDLVLLFSGTWDTTARVQAFFASRLGARIYRRGL